MTHSSGYYTLTFSIREGSSPITRQLYTQSAVLTSPSQLDIASNDSTSVISMEGNDTSGIDTEYSVVLRLAGLEKSVEFRVAGRSELGDGLFKRGGEDWEQRWGWNVCCLYDHLILNLLILYHYWSPQCYIYNFLSTQSYNYVYIVTIEIMYIEHVIYVIIAAVVGGMLLVVMVILTAVIIAVCRKKCNRGRKICECVYSFDFPLSPNS